eukprot:comp20554_c0_seq1/m.41661 comp20554_c0_seq1/g.41661  ORF comp20554_c0_seq1/g.41661 comp20554_c0_seq1/m.41661 type:complete len:330 (+) comp20554_c0_seq1:1072-2061(+)
MASSSAGGLATFGSWTWNSSGTRLRASLPRICSRGIHPLARILPSQLAMLRMQTRCEKAQMPRLWNPSSQRNPRGKNERLGTAVTKVSRNDSLLFPSGVFTRDLPEKYEMPPIRLLNAAFANSTLVCDILELPASPCRNTLLNLMSNARAAAASAASKLSIFSSRVCLSPCCCCAATSDEADACFLSETNSTSILCFSRGTMNWSTMRSESGSVRLLNTCILSWVFPFSTHFPRCIITLCSSSSPSLRPQWAKWSAFCAEKSARKSPSISFEPSSSTRPRWITRGAEILAPLLALFFTNQKRENTSLGYFCWDLLCAIFLDETEAVHFS